MMTTTVGRIARISDSDFEACVRDPGRGAVGCLVPRPAWIDRFAAWLDEHYPACCLCGNEIHGPATYLHSGRFPKGTPPRESLPPLPGPGPNALFAAFLEQERGLARQRERERKAELAAVRDAWTPPEPDALCKGCGRPGLEGWNESDWGGGPPPRTVTLLLPSPRHGGPACGDCRCDPPGLPDFECPDQKTIDALNALIDAVFGGPSYTIEFGGRLKKPSWMGHVHAGLFLAVGGTEAVQEWLAAADARDHRPSGSEAAEFESLFATLAGRHMTDTGPFADDGWPIVDVGGLCTGDWVPVAAGSPDGYIGVRWDAEVGMVVRVGTRTCWDNPDAYCSDIADIDEDDFEVEDDEVDEDKA